MDTQPINDQSPSPIEHPPLTNDHSCLRRGCSWSAGCGLFLIAALAFAAWFFSTPSAELRATLPQHFPNSIPIYRFDERDGITYLSGARFNQPFFKELTAFKLAVGKLLIQAHLLDANQLLVFNNETFAYNNVTLQWLKQFIKTPAGSQSDTVDMVWDNVNGSPAIVSKFYKQNFDTQDFFYVEALEQGQVRVINFNKKTIEGKITITPDTRNANQTAHIELYIQYLP